MCCKAEIVKRFEKAGMETGNKAPVCKVPEEIFGNKKLQVPFIRGLFDTDGSIFFKKSYNKNASKWQKSHKHVPVIQMASASFALTTDLRKMLSALGFNSLFSKYAAKNKNWNSMYYLRLWGKMNAFRFFQTVKPKNTRHLAKFQEWLGKGFY